MLVLLSLTLQIILFISGKRRKYVSSLWISIIVWAVYLMADFVAMVALGKLSDTKNTKPKNGVTSRAVWAPLLLLHLGGPDTIAVYSIEDKQLWKRHIIGVGVQIVFAGYVIFLSWRKSLLSIMSVLASVAGMIKFGERIWVLKLVSNDKWGDINVIPDANEDFANCSGREEKYVSALTLAGQLVKKVKQYISQNGFTPPDFGESNFHQVDEHDTYIWDVLEFEMGLMFDLLYTKANITYKKAGCILRSISFTCTVFMLVESLWLTVRKEKWPEYTMVDIAITIMLVGGALALDFCAVVLLLTSDWTMLLLIKHKRCEVIKFCKRNPWFFRMLKRRKWSKRMRQFDLLGFCTKKAKCSMLCTRLGLLGIVDNLCWYMHRTRVKVPPKLPSMIFSHVKGLTEPVIGGHDVEEDYSIFLIRKNFEKKILVGHIATEICYHLELESNKGNDDKIKTCRTLSHYMMYLLLTYPSMLPIEVLDQGFLDSDTQSKRLIDYLLSNFKTNDVQGQIKAWLGMENIDREANEAFIEALNFVLSVKQKGMEDRWKEIRSMWLNVLCYAAIKAPKNDHLQLLGQGGDLLTLVWLFISQIVEFHGNNFTYRKAAERNLIQQLVVLFDENDFNDRITQTCTDSAQYSF